MNIIHNWCIQAGIEALETKSERYNRARKRGYEAATKEYTDACRTLTESELDELCQQFKACRQMAKNTLKLMITHFLNFFGAFVIAFAAFDLLLLLYVVGLFDGWHDFGGVMVFVATVAALMLFGAIMTSDARSNGIATAYEFYGFAEGIIALADYRGLEKIDLSKLPDLETVIGEALY